MKPSAPLGGWENDSLEVLWEDTERIFCKLSQKEAEGPRYAFVPVLAGAAHPTLESINRLTHEYQLRDHLDAAWSLRPVELVRDRGAMLIVEYAGGEPLDRLIRKPMEIGGFLRLAVGLSAALSQLHARGLIHKDIKPANVFVDSASGQVWFTGFDSRLKDCPFRKNSRFPRVTRCGESVSSPVEHAPSTKYSCSSRYAIRPCVRGR